MKNGMRRLLGLCLALVILAGTVPALAEGSWVCTNCGQGGNWENYCTNCGAARPTSAWICTNCAKTGNTGNFCAKCGAPRPGQASAPVYAAVNDQLEQIPGETDRVMVRIYAVSAHDYIVAKDPMRWHFLNAVDGDSGTCWQFSTAKAGVLGYAWLEMTLASPQTVDSLWIKSGFWGTAEQYTNNARPRGIRVELRYSGMPDYTDSLEFTLADDKNRADWQRLELGRHTDVESVRIRVYSQYNGARSKNDVCISEVMLVQYASASTAMAPGTGALPIALGSVSTIGAANLLMRLSTRSGPGTGYDECGTFFDDNWSTQTVQVLGKSWDKSGGVWWVLVDFAYRGTRYRVWTGLKRVDVNADLLPEIYSSGQGTVNATETRRGPGGNYAKGPAITSWKDVVAYGRENGYVEVEYINEDNGKLCRCWVPESAASIDWNWNNNANN